MKIMTAALLLTALAATSSAKTPDTPKLDASEQKELAAALAGKTPGTPVECVSSFRGENLHAISDHTLIYRISKKLVYRNDLIGACSGLRVGDALVVHLQTDEYCRGDIANAVDLTTGAWHGSCALGSFVPYTSGGAG